MEGKKWSLKKAITWIIITNLITASVLIFVPIKTIGGKVLVNGDDYKFFKQYEKMKPVNDIIKDNYYEKIDDSKMVEGAIKGMVSALDDPYTVFMNKKEFDELKTSTQGSFTGVGIYIGDKDGKIVVVAPIEDSPAEKAGIKSGDIITKVNGQEVSAKESDKAVSMMKGKAGTKVKITIYREGVGEKDIEVTREKIVFKTVKSEMLPDNIAYIRITTFDENTSKAFVSALDDMKSKGMKGLILDLRDNPGGLLDECKVVADKLLGKGTIVYTLDKDGKKEVLESDEDKINVPLVVLTNGGTASASEIVSGAVRDHKAGTLIGTTTFGKGLVQTVIPLIDGTGIKVTTARYYTPSGECIQKKGIKPDIEVPLPDNLKDKPISELNRAEDVQLKKAIEVIKTKM
ncbi:MAG TPA: S41 family peptidase [Clostridiaceae bacterium]|jgi:carboxyl-terminal processing protease|nr:S41 family peptidase [Clostridiaceae bacterium]